jgi:YVTN family beta-propeller protein
MVVGGLNVSGFLAAGPHGTESPWKAESPSGEGSGAVGPSPFVGDSVHPASSASYRVAATISVGSAPDAVATDSANGYVYVANSGSNNVTVINGLTDAIVGSITVGSYPDAVTYDGANGYVFVANSGSDTVTIINGLTDTVVGSVPVGTYPVAMAYDSANGYVYVVDEGSVSFTVIDGETGSVVGSIAPSSFYINNLDAATYDDANGYVYAAGFNSFNLIVINGTTETVVGQIPLPVTPTAVAYDGANGNVYVANGGYGDYGNVTVVNVATGAVVGYIPVGSNPLALAYDDMNGYVYVVNEDSDNVTMINGATDTVVGSVEVGSFSQPSPADSGAVAYDSSNGNVYVANWGSDNVSVISSGIAINSSESLTADLVAPSVTIDPGVVLTTNGWSIIVSGIFDNLGTIITGSSPYENFPNSYGGSGGGADSVNFYYETDPGDSTVALGGPNYAQNFGSEMNPSDGSTPSAPTLSSGTIRSWYDSGMSGHLAGAGGGAADGISAGAGAYGIYIQANTLVSGEIDAAGQSGGGTCSGIALTGGGGGGTVILAYGSGGLTLGSVDANGGLGGINCVGTVWAGEGGNGQLIQFAYGSTPPLGGGSYNLFIHVADSSGTAIPDANVSVGGTTEITNTAGIAVFTLPNGSYNVTAYLAGYVSDSQVINLTSNQSVSLTLGRPYHFLGAIPASNYNIIEVAGGYQVSLLSLFAASVAQIFFDWIPSGSIPVGAGWRNFTVSTVPSYIVMAASPGSIDYPAAYYVNVSSSVIPPSDNGCGAFMDVSQNPWNPSITVNPDPPVLGSPTLIGVELTDSCSYPLHIAELTFQVSDLTVGNSGWTTIAVVSNITLEPGVDPMISVIWNTTFDALLVGLHHCIRVLSAYFSSLIPPQCPNNFCAIQHNEDIESDLLSGTVGVVDFTFGSDLPVSENATLDIGSRLPTGWATQVEINGQVFPPNATQITVDLAAGGNLNGVLTITPIPGAPGNGTVNLTVYVDGQLYGGLQKRMQELPLDYYPVEFTESGLPPGSKWSVTLGGSTETSTDAVIFFNRTNGAYPFAIGSVSGYEVAPASGTVNVNGGPVDNTIAFTTLPTTYKVAFATVPSDCGSIDFAGVFYTSGESTTGPAGEYPVSASPCLGYSLEGVSGIGGVDIVGGEANVNGNGAITATYAAAVTFFEYGLPMGITWSVTLAGTTQTSTANSMAFIESVGIYQFSVSAITGYTATPNIGPIVVTGAPVSQTIDFSTIIPLIPAGGSDYDLQVTLPSDFGTPAQFPSATVGHIIIQPNPWGVSGSSTGEITMNPEDLSSPQSSGLSTIVDLPEASNAAGDGVLGYSEVQYGYKPACTGGNAWEIPSCTSDVSEALSLPESLAAFDAVPSTWFVSSYQLQAPADQPTDFAYDLWLTNSPSATSVGAGDLEVMVWTDYTDAQKIIPNWATNLSSTAGPTEMPTLIDGTEGPAPYLVYLYNNAQSGLTTVFFVLQAPVASGLVGVDMTFALAEASQVLFTDDLSYWTAADVSALTLNDVELGSEFNPENNVPGSPAQYSWTLSSYCAVVNPSAFTSADLACFASNGDVQLSLTPFDSTIAYASSGQAAFDVTVSSLNGYSGQVSLGVSCATSCPGVTLTFLSGTLADPVQSDLLSLTADSTVVVTVLAYASLQTYPGTYGIQSIDESATTGLVEATAFFTVASMDGVENTLTFSALANPSNNLVSSLLCSTWWVSESPFVGCFSIQQNILILDPSISGVDYLYWAQNIAFVFQTSAGLFATGVLDVLNATGVNNQLSTGSFPTTGGVAPLPFCYPYVNCQPVSATQSLTFTSTLVDGTLTATNNVGSSTWTLPSSGGQLSDDGTIVPFWSPEVPTIGGLPQRSAPEFVLVGPPGSGEVTFQESTHVTIQSFVEFSTESTFSSSVEQGLADTEATLTAEQSSGLYGVVEDTNSVCLDTTLSGCPGAIGYDVAEGVFFDPATSTTTVQGGSAFGYTSLPAATVGVLITGSTATDGTPVTISALALSGPPLGTVALGTTPAAYYDVSVTGISDGVATICISAAGVSQSTTLRYLSDGEWFPATDVSASASTTCGQIPVSALSGTIIAIAPLSLYLVTFTESGLPAKTLAKYGWTVVLNGVVEHSKLTTIGFTLPNGTYAALITGPSGYRVAGGGGGLVAGSTQSVRVSGTSTTVTPLFVKGPTLTLAFSEKGLPKGQSWCVEVDDYKQCSAKSGVSYLNLTPGSRFTYAVLSPLVGQEITASVGRTAYPLSGTLTLAKTETMGLTFAYPYAVTFTDRGLPSSTTWCVQLGKSSECSFGWPIVFDVSNGTYAYKVTVGTGYSLTPSSGKVVVSGRAVTVGLSAYTVVFTESGLPSGTAWCVQLAKNTVCSTSGSIGFTYGNGTYAYTVGAVRGYTISPSTGKVTVAGAPVAVTVTFTQNRGSVPAVVAGTLHGTGKVGAAGASGPLYMALLGTTALGLLGAAWTVGRTRREV